MYYLIIGHDIKFVLIIRFNTSLFKTGSFESFTAALIRGHMLQEVTVNASYKIDCDVFGGDNVIWRKNDKELQVEKQQKYNGGNVNDPSLEIRKISSLDRGNYTCETTYRSVTAKSKTIQLNVRGIYKI